MTEKSTISSSPNKFVLNLAPTGVIPTKAMTPYVPITPEEVAADVREALALGISSVHIHARDEKGMNTSDKTIYSNYIEAIRKVDKNLVICVSCSGRVRPDFESRSDVLTLEGILRPEMASLTLSSLNFSQSASINEPTTIIRLAEKMQTAGIKPELEIFDVGMMSYAQYMIKKGYLQPPYYFNIILGNIFSAQAQLLHLGTILSELPENSIWIVGGIGKAQLPSAMLALSQGGGIRVGLEDNIWFDTQKTQLATNASLLKRVHGIANLMETEVMSSLELRHYMKMI